MLIQENVALAPLTTFQIGGPAKLFVEASSEDDILSALQYAKSNHLSVFILGGGSNLVVSDAGFSGLVIKIALRGMQQKEIDGAVEFDVAAGENWDEFVSQAVAQNCAGIETLSGIPGSVGGTPVQNVGAYGQEVSSTIVSVRVLDQQTMRMHDLTNAECRFSYRRSVFNTTERDRFVVVSVRFRLRPGGVPCITYDDLQKYFSGFPAPPTLQQTREAVRKIRLSKAMLIVPNDDDCRSAGSFFKNPIVTQEKYNEVVAKAAQQSSGEASPPPPGYPAGDGMVKLSAAWLVENSGMKKGYSRGAAGISRRHALAIVNRGGATAEEIVNLKNEIQMKVVEAFGIELFPEPVFVGFA